MAVACLNHFAPRIPTTDKVVDYEVLQAEIEALSSEVAFTNLQFEIMTNVE